MIRLNKKFLISIIALLVLFATVFAVLSFTLADESRDNTLVAADTTTNGPSTIIDYIIEFSNSTDAKVDKTYHVLELGSSDTPSDLEKLISSDGFRNYVINENKSENYIGKMAAGADKIEYIYYNVCEGKLGKVTVTRTTNETGEVVVSTKKTSATNAEIVKAIQKADLIYLSNDANTRFEKDNDFSEEVKIALSSYATNDNKPLIIDSHRLTIQSITYGQRTMSDIVSSDFKRYGNKYATKKWDDSKNAEQFMNPTNMDFVGINGNAQKSNWLKYDDGNGLKRTAKVLTIYKGSGDADLTTKLKYGLDKKAKINATSTDALNKTELAGLNLDNLYILKEGTSLYNYGYRGRSLRPDYVYFDSIDIESNLADLADTSKYDLSSYDYIIIEKGTKSVDFKDNKESENALLTAMYANVHILYSSSLYVKKDDVTIPENTAANYAYVYDKVATSTDVARFGFILVGTRKKMSSFNLATSGEGVKEIADVINAGTFRGIGGNSSGDSSNIYTALEIEPCYPIDDVLSQLFNEKQGSETNAVRAMQDPQSLYSSTGKAEDGKTMSFEANSYRTDKGKTGLSNNYSDKGFYYLRTDGVLDATSDEISYDGTNSISTMLRNHANNDDTIINDTFTTKNAANIQDYYKWNLSKAKVAHALGVSYDEVNVVHMSSAEFAASKVSVIDNYDMIYIGGNTSAITSDERLNSSKNAEVFYRMYRHNGDTYDYPNANGETDFDTVGVLTGNDITDDKLKELKDYLDLGMPVIIDKDVTSSFDNNADIDPNSNMYEFLTYANLKKFRTSVYEAGKNALWGFDYDSVVRVANDDGKYGQTYGGFATVFGGLSLDYTIDTEFGATPTSATTYTTDDNIVDEKYLSPLIKNNQRIRFVLTSMPNKYIEGDPTSYIKAKDFNFKYKITNKLASDETAKVRVFIDDDSNNRFTEKNPDEVRKTEKVSGNSGEIGVGLPDDYFGVVYWKFEIDVYKTIKKNGEDVQVLTKVSSTTGTCKVANEKNEKMVVDLLEIVPVVDKNTPSANNTFTLSFCTECDMSKTIYTVNRYGDVGKYGQQYYEGQRGGTDVGVDKGCGFTHDGDSCQSLSSVVSTIKNDNYYKVTVDNSAPDTNPYKRVNSYLTYNYEGNSLGVHDHKFGIMKYYGTYNYSNLNKGRNGMDDITSNWFDDIRDDYEVNLTILTTKEYDRIVDIVNSFYADDTIDNEVVNYRIGELKAEIISDYRSTLVEADEDYNKTDTVLWDEHTEWHSRIPSVSDVRASISKEYKVEYYKNKFNEEYEKYNSYYNTIHSLINGNAAATTNLPFTIPDVGKYQTCVSNLDKFLAEKDSSGNYIYANTFTGKTSSDLAIKEIEHETDASIPGSERNYYDIYSLVGSEVTPFYQNFSDLYNIWRNAKVYELYFKQMAQKYKILSSVNTSGTYKNTLDISNTFNCIVLGGADEFHIKNTTDDLEYNSIDSLLDYTDDGNNMILFHGSLTAKKDSTKRMSEKLRAPFAQDARHLEYTNTDNQLVENIITVNLGGKSKVVKFSPTDDTITLNATAGDTKLKDTEVYFVGHYQNGGADQTSPKFSIPSDVVSADLQFVVNDSGNVSRVQLANVVDGDSSAHDISLKPYLMVESNNGLDRWNRYYDPTIIYQYKNDLTKVDCYINGYKVTLNERLDGAQTLTVANGTVSGGGFGESTKTDYSGSDEEHSQYLKVKLVDKTNTPVVGASITATNRIDGSPQTAVTNDEGIATFTYSNYNANVTNSTGVRAMKGYKNSEYFISPTLGNKIPNTYTLTPFYALKDAVYDGGGNVALPYKYTFFSNQLTSEQSRQRQQDNRDKIHNGVNEMTDKTSQVNKGIVTMYPFAIGSQMKISTTVPQSYSLDIEDPDVTVYYTLAGGTSGTVSSYLAADPHNGQDNYFIYQYHNVYYCGAGRTTVTGYGKENNDERRLFINIIVNSARKSTAAPDLTLHDSDSSYDASKDEYTLNNDDIKKCSDGTADYITYISDYSDELEFKFLPTISNGATLNEVNIYFDTVRSGTDEKEVYNYVEGDLSNSDRLLYKRGRVENVVDSGVLTLVKHTETGILAYPSGVLGGNPVIKLIPEYFDSSNAAYVVVEVTDNKGGTAQKTLKIQIKPELLDLN